ncbi:hypothetical protein [Chitinimonas sp. JJ19]|uniref:hypothetical protein n=1 Tax=Chitinimonas sp. JJ19 TaxID=3109352 RepID=UPI003001BE4A
MAERFRSALSLSQVQASPIFDTVSLFDSTHQESQASPLDEFLARLNAINRLAPSPANFDHLQSQLVMLGVIAAVESYLRALLRKIITLDDLCQRAVESRDVSFGAALHLSKGMMPEALLERVSFVSRESIVDSMRTFLSVKGNLPEDVDLAIKDYLKVCQIRHCAVHRFGKLGVSNAIALGLTEHKALLEKPLQLDYSSLQNAIAISTGFVKVLNNHLFNEIITRVMEGCRGRWKDDKKLFVSYYNLFCDTTSAARSRLSCREVYDEFIKQKSNFESGAHTRRQPGKLVPQA